VRNLLTRRPRHDEVSAVELYLVRHGIAEKGGDMGDVQRALTPKGRARMEAIARALRILEVRPDLILTSPLRRAQETAAILARGLGNVELTELSQLALNGAHPSELSHLLSGYQGVETLMVVGHQPSLGKLASFLLCGSPEGCELEFKKGGVARLYAQTGGEAVRYRLEWLLGPRVMRKI